MGLAEWGPASPGSSQVSILEETELRGVSKGRFARCCLSQVATTRNTPAVWSNLRTNEIVMFKSDFPWVAESDPNCLRVTSCWRQASHGKQ